jgi:hypothetical protein
MDILYRIWIFATTLSLFGLFLLTSRERLVQLTIDEKISHDSAGTPSYTVSPSLDTLEMMLALSRSCGRRGMWCSLPTKQASNTCRASLVVCMKPCQVGAMHTVALLLGRLEFPFRLDCIVEVAGRLEREVLRLVLTADDGCSNRLACTEAESIDGARKLSQWSGRIK